jgi:Zn-dependent protease with chaperone function
MDFFTRQDQARRKTWLLILYFVVAIAATVLVVNVVVDTALRLLFVYSDITSPGSSQYTRGWLASDTWLYVSLMTIGVIVSGSLYKLLRLSDGGVAVALMVGAIPVVASSKNPADKTFTNVVEEMAIASGMPVPQLFVLENETSINAFVAGFRPTEAVMVVTRGALEQLDRDELQGVVGHEFSHILNGDMRINLRLLAILAGILLIGKIGEVMMRGAKEGEGRGALFILLLGLALYLVGYTGLFFGRVIKAAISRQREFLADAASVQFTRNPRGLTGALFKIQGSDSGTILQNAYAEDLSHMCIAESMNVNSWLATHPPLAVRIQAIDPSYLGTQRAKKIIARRKTESSLETIVDGQIQALSDSVGNISGQQMALASEIHHAMPSALIQSVHAIEGATGVVYALLDAQNLPADIQSRVNKLREITGRLDRRMRLPLIDMTLPQLKRMTTVQRLEFLNTLGTIIRSDKRYTLNEFVILTIIKQHLSANAGRADVVKYHSFKYLMEDVRILLSMMVLCSGQSAERKSTAWKRAINTFTSADVSMIEVSAKPAQISQALEKIRQTPMLLRKSFIDVCADLVMDDGIIMPAEAELLRAICESIDCPMPLLVTR